MIPDSFIFDLPLFPKIFRGADLTFWGLVRWADGWGRCRLSAWGIRPVLCWWCGRAPRANLQYWWRFL